MKMTMALLLCVFALSGCGVPQADYDQLEGEIGILEEQLDEANLEKVKLEKANAELTGENIRLGDQARELMMTKAALEERINFLEDKIKQEEATVEEMVEEPLSSENIPESF